MTTVAPPMPLLADRVHRIGTEAAFSFGALIEQVERSGAHVIRCNIGQPDFPLPRHIADAVKVAIDRGLTLGGAGSAFAGDYAVKGCHAYTQWATTAEWRGAAFFGTGGGETDVEAEFGEDARATDSPQNERVRLRCTAEHNAATR